MQALEFEIATQDLVKIGLAVLCGGFLGIERQYKNKTAGFRTIILICLGSAIFTMVAQRAGAGVNINIVTGIGFIGAGVIFKDNVTISGLTTAAVIWISAAIGMSVGSGNYTLALVSTLLSLMVLLLFNLLERYIDKVHHDKMYQITFNSSSPDNLATAEMLIKKHHLAYRRVKVSKVNECMQIVVLVTGKMNSINRLDEELLQMVQVISF